MKRKRTDLVGYQFDYENATPIAATAWCDNLNYRRSLYSVLIVAGETEAAKEYARWWRFANRFRKAHDKPRLRLA